MHDHRGAPCGWVAMQGWRRPMALNGTGIEFGKSEHDSRRITSRATTTSAHFILLGQRCGVQVVLQKVGRDNRPPPVTEIGAQTFSAPPTANLNPVPKARKGIRHALEGRWPGRDDGYCRACRSLSRRDSTLLSRGAPSSKRVADAVVLPS